MEVQEFKCIKENCPMYKQYDFSTIKPENNIIQVCMLKIDELLGEECIGLKHIQPYMEMIACKISALTTKYNTLATLGDWIRDNQ